jgi:regulator of extracellular matrix RemA (YlzA/DUF370 family)
MLKFNLFHKNKTKFQLDLSTNKEIIDYLKRIGYPLLFILKNQNIELCMEAINQRYYTCEAMKDIINQTDELCIEAVKNNGMALQFVKNQTPEICLLAVKENGMALQFVINQTHEICLSAVKQNGMALQFVINQTHEICLSAVKGNGMALQFVINQTHEICLSAVKGNGMALQFIKDKEYKLLFIITNINIKSDNICSICISQNDNEWCEIVDCMHIFHKDCLIRWLEEKNNCPICRNNL